jgi:hypothetical protein
MEQTWALGQMDGGDVRLRNAQGSGLMNLDVTAPVRAGSLRAEATRMHLDLTIALDQIKTGNFLTEHAARAFIAGYRAHDLTYAGSGHWPSEAVSLKGPAKAGAIDVEIELTVSPVDADWEAMSEIEIVGTAGFGKVHIPIPGVGTVDDLIVDIDARLRVKR